MSTYNPNETQTLLSSDFSVHIVRLDPTLEIERDRI